MRNFEYIVDSNKEFEKLIEDIETELKKIKFKIVGRIDIHKNILNKGHDFNKKVAVLEVCNADEAYEILRLGTDISVFLPCKFTVTEDEDGAKIRMPKPTYLLDHYENEEWSRIARNVEDLLIGVMEESK